MTRVGQLLFRGHLQIRIAISNRFDEAAFFRFAQDKGYACVAALEHPLATVEIEVGLKLLCLVRMAFVAAVSQDRPDLFLEEFDASQIRRESR